MFKSYAERLAFKPKDGMQVMVFGSVSVFERDGAYQIYVKSMLEDGMGDLHERYEQLKKQLEEEGLFDEKHKKAIPVFPKEIGDYISNWCSNKRYNKCINKKKSKCKYKILASSSTGGRCRG